MSNNIIDKYSNILDLASAERSNRSADLLINFMLILSSVFTVLYMVLAFGGALLGIGWPGVWAYALGGLLGVAAVAPGELAIYVWRVKLTADPDINDRQIVVAWIAGLVGAISAAVSTVSFFAFVLSGLMPAWYDPTVANGVNVSNIAVSWSVLGIAVFVYSAISSRAEQNKERARAAGLIQAGQNKMRLGIAGGIQEQILRLVAGMAESGQFSPDAINMIAGDMGLDGDRLDAVRRLTGGDPAAAASSPAAAPSPAKKRGRRPAQKNGATVENFP